MVKNRKGFMLAELVISATVVISTMVGLYSLYSKLYNKYKEKNSYYSIDAMYATKEMIDVMISKNEFNTFINRTLSISSSGFIIKDGKLIEDESSNSNLCDNSNPQCVHIKDSVNAIKELYGIKNMVIVEYSLCSLVDDNKCGEGSTPLISVVSNQTFKDYIHYLVTYYDIENLAVYTDSNDDENEDNDEKKNDYHYLVLTEIEEKENYKTYYASMRIR